jgi:hypothetical protein
MPDAETHSKVTEEAEVMTTPLRITVHALAMAYPSNPRRILHGPARREALLALHPTSDNDDYQE